MVSINNKNQGSRKPAENYRKRARVVLEHMLMHMKAFTDSETWKEPTDQTMEQFIDEFHHIINWALDGVKGLRLSVGHFPGPLTEEEMRVVESKFLKDVRIIRLD